MNLYPSGARIAGRHAVTGRPLLGGTPDRHKSASFTCASTTKMIAAMAILVAALLMLLWNSAPGKAQTAIMPQRSGRIPYTQTAAPPAGVDLDVAFINRTPLYKAYCVQYMGDVPNQPGRPFLCPGAENDRRWPEPGEVVTFTAHIVNKGTVASPAFGYAWRIDGAEVARGALPPLPPGAEITATYQWPWGHGLSADGQRALGEHTVRFTADPENAVAESHESNNSLEDRTEAMSFSIYITPEMYAAYNIPVDPKYPCSAEDWLQKQIAAMNANFASSIYPAAPQGATLRVRINAIGITPTDPGPDGEHDGGWFVTADYRRGASAWYDPATDIDWALIHELSHQVSLIDLYAIGVYAANVSVLGRNGMPANIGFGWPGGGIMGGGDISPYTDHRLYSSHSAGGASTYAGYRNGYYGSYQFDIPLNNYLRILDNQGNPASGVQVALYQRTGPWDWTPHMGVDNTPEISGATDASGVFLLPNRSANGGAVTLNGHVLHDNPFGVVDIIGNQGLFLIRLVQGDHEEFHWLDITQFNLAYWLGDTISHTFTISSHAPPPGAPIAPALLTPRVAGSRVSLNWSPSPSQGVIGYRVYRATPPIYNYIAASGLLADTQYEEEFGGPYDDGQHRTYTVTAVSGDGLESGFSRPVYAPGIGEPVAVALAPDGARVVLNNWNPYPLLRQDGDGAYTQRLVNPHYDMSLAHSLAYDPAGRLLVSGFGQSPFGRHAIRVYDAGLRPLTAFGDEGAAPGQFDAPAGVASWGQTCTYGGPYQADAHTLLLLHLDGSYAGAQGQAGTPNGAGFAAGRYGQGVLLDEGDTLTYRTAGNLNLTEGAIEFWLRPDWDGNDKQDYAFFEVGNDWFNRIRIAKDGGNHLRIVVWDSSAEYGAGHLVDDWKAGEWRHIGVTWQEGIVALYEDGVQVDRQPARFPDWLAEPMYVGSGSWDGRVANGVIDEFRISSAPRLGNSDSCSRILVADSGNHRVQAFDSLGRFVSAFGAFGSGPGQFDNPQGLVVHSSGRVIVADSGNDRLQLLSFDGVRFGFLRSITAGFNRPTGLAADSRSNVAVADTGNNRVVLFSAEGRFLAEYSQPNDGYTGTFNAPRGVAIEPDGDLVVADTGNHRVVMVRSALLAPRRIWLPLAMRR